MDDSSLKLTKAELEIFTDPEIFKSKVRISTVIIDILEKLQLQLANDFLVKQINTHFDLPNITGKISKGENYLGYPWQILDYPRVFKKENVFAYRTLCWWGNFYSCTIHIGGAYYLNVKKIIAENLHVLKEFPVFICINDKQWDHHFELNNYQLLKDVYQNSTLLEQILDQHFIKLSCKFPLEEIDQLEKNAIESFKLFSKTLFLSC